MHKGFSIAGRVPYYADMFLKIKTVCLLRIQIQQNTLIHPDADSVNTDPKQHWCRYLCRNLVFFKKKEKLRHTSSNKNMVCMQCARASFVHIWFL